MEYCGFSIILEKQRMYEELPSIPLQKDDYNTVRPARKESKGALSTTTKLEVYIENCNISNTAFLFELRTILDEFSNKG